MFSALKIPFLSLALCAVFAPASRADGFGLSYPKKTKHGQIAVGYSSGPFWAPGYRARCAPASWVPGHYETVRERVWVPGSYARIWVEPVHTWRRDACGRAYQVYVSSGHYEMVKEPGRYEVRDVQVWVAGGWQT